MAGSGRGYYLGSASYLNFPGYYDQSQHQPPYNQYMNPQHPQPSPQPWFSNTESLPRSTCNVTESSATNTSSTSSSPELKSTKEKKTYDKWPENEQKTLIRLWADNLESLESKDARKVWDTITRELNTKFGTTRTTDKVKNKIKYWIERYKIAKDWNLKQSGGSIRKSVHYEEIDEVLGCRDSVMLSRVGEAGSSNAASDEASSIEDQACNESKDSKDQRTTRKKTKKRAREVEQDDEERKMFKDAFSGLESQRTEMSTFMNNFNKNQEQQLATMNTLVGALATFLKDNNGKQ